jgi:hypothetical protein
MAKSLLLPGNLQVRLSFKDLGGLEIRIFRHLPRVTAGCVWWEVADKTFARVPSSRNQRNIGNLQCPCAAHVALLFGHCERDSIHLFPVHVGVAAE